MTDRSARISFWKINIRTTLIARIQDRYNKQPGVYTSDNKITQIENTMRQVDEYTEDIVLSSMEQEISDLEQETEWMDDTLVIDPDDEETGQLVANAVRLQLQLSEFEPENNSDVEMIEPLTAETKINFKKNVALGKVVRKGSRKPNHFIKQRLRDHEAEVTAPVKPTKQEPAEQVAEDDLEDDLELSPRQHESPPSPHKRKRTRNSLLAAEDNFMLGVEEAEDLPVLKKVRVIEYPACLSTNLPESKYQHSPYLNPLPRTPRSSGPRSKSSGPTSKSAVPTSAKAKPLVSLQRSKPSGPKVKGKNAARHANMDSEKDGDSIGVDAQPAQAQELRRRAGAMNKGMQDHGFGSSEDTDEGREGHSLPDSKDSGSNYVKSHDLLRERRRRPVAPVSVERPNISGPKHKPMAAKPSARQRALAPKPKPTTPASASTTKPAKPAEYNLTIEQLSSNCSVFENYFHHAENDSDEIEFQFETWMESAFARKQKGYTTLIKIGWMRLRQALHIFMGWVMNGKAEIVGETGQERSRMKKDALMLGKFLGAKEKFLGDVGRKLV